MLLENEGFVGGAKGVREVCHRLAEVTAGQEDKSENNRIVFNSRVIMKSGFFSVRLHEKVSLK